MTESDNSQTATGRRRGVWPRRGLWLAAALGLAVLVLVGLVTLMGLTGKALPMPGLLVDRIEARANGALAGRGRLTIARADLVVTPSFLPQVRLADVTLLSARGERLARIADLRGSLDPGALMGGRIEPARLVINGARVAVRQSVDGRLDIAPDAGRDASAPRARAQSPAEVLDAVDAVFQLPTLAGLNTVKVTALDILFDDRRGGQIWTIRDGAFDLTRGANALTMRLGFDLYGGTSVQAATSAGAAPGPQNLGRADFTLKSAFASSRADLSARIGDISARDLASSVPALAWLGAVDAPISGAVDTGLDDQGGLAAMHATLDLGKGALRPTDDTSPVTFDGAHLDLNYDPASRALTVGDIRIESPALTAQAAGRAWLKGGTAAAPEALVGQVRLSKFSANPDGVFARTVTIGEGMLDFKVDLNPFRLRIGQLVLVDQGRRISARGDVTAADKGWAVALDFGIDAIQTDRLLALWPVRAVPKTRDWLIANVATGELFDVKGALRLAPGQEPRLALGYRYRGAVVRFLKTLPPIRDGEGYAAIEDYAYTIVTEKGRIAAPQGGDLDVAGSVLHVPDLRARPTRAEITLKTRGSITGTLAILNEPPFRFLSKAEKPVDLFTGTASLTTHLTIPLIGKIRVEDVGYRAVGQVTGAATDRLIPGRVLTAKVLDVAVDKAGLTLSGRAALDGVPVDGRWTQPFGPEHKGSSRVEGTVELTPEALKTFSIALPDGAVKGRGQGQLTVDLARGAAPELRLTSDLGGLTLAVPEIGWEKPADQKGTLTVEARLDKPIAVTRLELEGAGLSAKAQLKLKPDGAFDRIVIPGLTVGDWLTADATLIGRGKGLTVGVEVSGGTVDLRRADFGKAEAVSDDDAPVTIALDRLTITDSIALTGFRGDFRSGGGLNGDFIGQVNGQVPVVGRMAPAPSGRAAFRVQADDAGAVMAAAGIYDSGREGRLDMTLMPEGQDSYDGHVNIRSLRVVDAPELAGLLNAISVVGLITELQGAGIFFTDVEGRFLLTPGAIELRQGSAIGPSLGVSAAGLYRSGSGEFDLQGVISPIYLLNGIGQIFSRKQRDGLFGFNYTMTGTRAALHVGVNPLSILTPGMFRDLFRKDPPTLGQ